MPEEGRCHLPQDRVITERNNKKSNIEKISRCKKKIFDLFVDHGFFPPRYRELCNLDPADGS